MKNRFLVIAIFLSWSFIGSVPSAFAINAPLLGSIPDKIDADIYELIVYTQKGATISVVGGSSELSPVTDGQMGDIKDGEIRIKVPLAQNTLNHFSITARMNEDVSGSIQLQINEVSGSVSMKTPPEPPFINSVPDFVDALQYIITGTAEAQANIYVRSTEGEALASTKTDSAGKFQVKVPLQKNKTNRFNVSAENEDGKEGKATQIIIRQSAELPEKVEEESIPKLLTSSQIFFSDLEGHWAKEYINELRSKEVVSGKSGGIFDPNGLITRAELTKIAILAFGHSINTNVDEHPFQDVPKNAWFAPYVEEAKRLGFVEGYPTGGFGPNDFITRAAALKILLGAAEVEASKDEANFTDVPAGLWFSSYVGFAYKNSIVNGYENGTFGPADNMTRAQVAKVVVKLLEFKNLQDS